MKKLILISLCLIPLVSGCSGESSAEQEKSTVIVPVKIARLVVGDMNRIVTANGQTEALKKETVLSQVAGTVTALNVLEGSVVRSGDTLAVIETKESQAAVAGAEALVAAATTEQQKADAQRALELARKYESKVAVRSKLGGIVSARNIASGALVGEGAELFSVIDPTSIEFVAQISLPDLKQVTAGMPALVELPSSGVPLRAVVSAISPQSDPASQTVRSRLDFAKTAEHDPRLLKDGAIGVARIITAVDKNVLLAPRAALLRNDETNTYTIVTIAADSLSMSIPVSVTASTDTTVEISGPELKVGMPVIIEGHYALPDSTRVTVK
jgi:membrane fusion protein (multidrug efflux system)